MPRTLRLVIEGSEEPKTLTLLDVNDVRKRISVPPLSAATIRSWTREGCFPQPYQLGIGDKSPWLWREADVDKWVAEQMRNEKGPLKEVSADLRFDDDKEDKNSGEEMRCQTVKNIVT
jgi:predicted DNA-binding transcriptional regulator AlpA